MKLLKVKTARFSQVVEKCGRPEVYTLWQKPAADRHLQSHIKNNRVITIQKSESGSDFGIVGFKERKGATYLLFPKSLKRFADSASLESIGRLFVGRARHFLRAALARWPGERAFTEQMHMQMRHALACVGSAVDYDAVTTGKIKLVGEIARHKK